ncbi:hypothetical protein CIRMBP1257_00515 [Enterococcus cecorum]|nr:hypothetical protein CIRMBP1257_00515 [Enterococcus cecorum]
MQTELFKKFLNAETYDMIMTSISGSNYNRNHLYKALKALDEQFQELEKHYQDNSIDLFEQENIDNLMQQAPAQEQDETTQETDEVAQESIEQDNATQWIIKFNECDEIVPIFDNEIVTPELLNTIKELDIKTTNLHNGYYKFFFEKIENGQVTKKIRFDIGGWDKTQIDDEFYNFMLSEISTVEAVENSVTVTQEQVQDNVKDLLKSYVKDEAIEILDDNQASDLLNTLERINSVIAKFSKDEPSKLERLKQEKAAVLNDWASYSVNNAGGQPMNDKKNNRSFYNGLERVENRIRSLDEQIEKQESIEARKRERKAGYNKNGGLLLTIDNIDRIRLEIEKAAQGQSIYSASTIRKYKKALIELEKQLEATENNHNEKLDELIASGKLNQWKKQPTIFFLKGYRKLAIKMLDNGNFEIAKKYAPKDDKEKKAIENILNQLAA